MITKKYLDCTEQEKPLKTCLDNLHGGSSLKRQKELMLLISSQYGEDQYGLSFETREIIKSSLNARTINEFTRIIERAFESCEEKGLIGFSPRAGKEIIIPVSKISEYLMESHGVSTTAEITPNGIKIHFDFYKSALNLMSRFFNRHNYVMAKNKNDLGCVVLVEI